MVALAGQAQGAGGRWLWALSCLPRERSREILRAVGPGRQCHKRQEEDDDKLEYAREHEVLAADAWLCCWASRAGAASRLGAATWPALLLRVAHASTAAIRYNAQRLSASGPAGARR